MPEPLTKEHLDEQIDTVLRTVKDGFDAVDKRFEVIEKDIVYIKEDIKFLKNEVRSLGANMVTKPYLDEKIDQLYALQQKDSLFKRTLLLALEQAKVLTPEARAKLESLIPS